MTPRSREADRLQAARYGKKPDDLPAEAADATKKGASGKYEPAASTRLQLAAVGMEAEFALVLARRCADGGVEPIAVLEDEAMVERAIKRAGI